MTDKTKTMTQMPKTKTETLVVITETKAKTVLALLSTINLTTVNLLQSNTKLVSNKSPTADSELFCTYCRPTWL